MSAIVNGKPLTEMSVALFCGTVRKAQIIRGSAKHFPPSRKA
jgi:hypothetical protein